MNPIDYWYQKYLKEKLTWRDIADIDAIIHAVDNEHLFTYGKSTAKEVYEEVLKRFNEQRKK